MPQDRCSCQHFFESGQYKAHRHPYTRIKENNQNINDAPFYGINAYMADRRPPYYKY